jgi:4-coumarate--CoA ligase (photoactive yellow protein activation family)
MIDCHSFLLVLQSLTRAYLLKRNPAEIMPLADMSASTFAVTSWSELHIAPTEASELTALLQKMFPGPEVVVPGRLPSDCAENVFSTWKRGEQTVVYESSGSSGPPKRLVHRLEAVVQEVGTVAALFAGVKHIVGLTPQHHCYGFIFGVLLHKQLGASYQVLPPLPTVINGVLEDNALFVGYPGLWTRFRPAPDTVRLKRVCLSAGAPWPENDIEELRTCSVNILEIYGSSENGAMGYRRKAGPFTLIDYWKPIKNADKIIGLSRLMPSGLKLRQQLQDVLEWQGDTHFRPLRRMDGAVQVNGMNVYPATVVEVIAKHPQVKECVVRLMRREEGGRLKAFVVPVTAVTNSDFLRVELKRFCKERLTTPERPGAYTFGETLPVNGFGKNIDWKI